MLDLKVLGRYFKICKDLKILKFKIPLLILRVKIVFIKKKQIILVMKIYILKIISSKLKNKFQAFKNFKTVKWMQQLIFDLDIEVSN